MQLSVSFRFVVLAGVAVVSLLPIFAAAETTAECNFGRTLDLGVEGEDVRCLQEFLNARGVIIASEGPGSPGNETTRYGSLTEAAVLKWQQQQGIAGANGVFGPQSQAAYLLDRVNVLQGQMAVVTPVATAPTPQVAGAATSATTESALTTQFLKALTAIEAGDDEVEYRILNDQAYDNHLRALNKAKRSFFAAATAYFTGSVSQVPSLLNAVIDNAEMAANDKTESTSKSSAKTTSSQTSSSDADEDEAWDEVDAAWDEYDDVKEIIDEADDDGEDTDEAYDLLKQASKTLQKAEDAIDDEDFDEAIDLADEAQDLLNDAQKSV